MLIVNRMTKLRPKIQLKRNIAARDYCKAREQSRTSTFEQLVYYVAWPEEGQSICTHFERQLLICTSTASLVLHAWKSSDCYKTAAMDSIHATSLLASTAKLGNLKAAYYSGLSSASPVLQTIALVWNAVIPCVPKALRAMTTL